jgi:hypothetical protein
MIRRFVVNNIQDNIMFPKLTFTQIDIIKQPYKRVTFNMLEVGELNILKNVLMELHTSNFCK